MKQPILLFYCLLLWVGACKDPEDFTLKDAKQQTVKFFPEVEDTNHVGGIEISQDKHNHWFVTYNNTHAYHPRVYLFHHENPEETAHIIDLKHKINANIERVMFEDVTMDGEPELLLELHFDFELAYQARELLIFQHPFDEEKKREIFDMVFEERREFIEGFDEEFGMPIHRVEIENHAVFQFFEGFILLKGTIKHHKNHVLEFQWDPSIQQFKKVLDEDLHEADDEEKGGITHKVKGTKMLKSVTAHEDGCKSYLLEDTEHHVIDIGHDVHDALLCSPLTSLSPQGRFLVYTDKVRHTIQLLDFNTNQNFHLAEHIYVYEGMSEVLWHSKLNRLAFVIINPEEFAENTAILLAEVDDNGILHKHLHHVRVVYKCPPHGDCLPQRDYDYYFDVNGHLHYRISDTGDRKRDFALLSD